MIRRQSCARTVVGAALAGLGLLGWRWPVAAIAQVPSEVAAAPPAIIHRVMEAYPALLQVSLEQRDRLVASIPGRVDGEPLESVFKITQRWPQRKVLRVAFLDGDATLHRAVAEAAQGWLSFCNLQLDFGLEPNTGRYRRWTTADRAYQAEIRIAFDQSGYYSLVGTDSINPIVGEPGDPDGGRPGQRSMNFGGYKDALPPDYQGTVLHEFGHALSFEHEHQHPTQGCDQDFRWNDDPGYVPTRDQFRQFIPDSRGRRPGIYTVLGGPPNRWPRTMVVHNLRELPESHAYVLGPFDKLSIMKYYFDSWMFTSGAVSHCFSSGENVVLSDGDKRAVAEQYPPIRPAAEAVAGGRDAAARIASRESVRLQAIDVLTRSPDLPDGARRHYESLRGPLGP
jgi:hypothetical protein